MTAKRLGAWLDVTSQQVEIERTFGEGWIMCRHTCAWQPPTDVYEDDTGLVVRIEVAGLREQDFAITLTGNRLVVTGTRVDSEPKRTYHQMEIPFGDFRAEIHTSWEPTPENVRIGYEQGFLTIRLLRA